MENRNRRSSILKVRQHIDITDETTVAGNGSPGASTTNRRVSFHNVKHVKQYDRDHGKLIDASPLREKITDTMDSDGILTPRGRTLDASVAAANQSIHVFDNVDQGAADMSLETVNENAESETMQLFNITREQTVVVEKSITRTVTERVVERHVASNDTMSLFNMTDCDEKDMSVDQSTFFAVPRVLKQNATINQSMQMDLDESNIGAGPAPGPSNNDTMNLFNLSVASAKNMDISNVPMDETIKELGSPACAYTPRLESPRGIATENSLIATNIEEMTALLEQRRCKDDTMSLFNMTDCDKKDMSVDHSAVFAVPRVLNQDATINQSMQMDLDESNIGAGPAPGPSNNDTINLFNMSVASAKNMDVSNITMSETFKEPRSPVRACNSRLESPRRIAIENSMISMNIGEISALSEPRRRKSLLQTSHLAVLNSSTASLLNESLNVSKGRDIFALNTSVRSPQVSRNAQSGNDSTIVRVPETSSFHMPNFDPAITNMVWLTPEEGEEVVPEAAEFASLIAVETLKAEQEVQRALQNENLEKEKAEAVRTGQWAKLSHDEKDAVLLARQAAEIRFLELRLVFASKTRLKYEKEVQEQLETNARLAEQLNDVEDIDALRQEIEELKNRPTEADYRRVKDELNAVKVELVARQVIALAERAATLIHMKNLKTELQMEIEEREEKLARLQILEESEKEEMKKKVKDLQESMQDY